MNYYICINKNVEIKSIIMKILIDINIYVCYTVNEYMEGVILLVTPFGKYVRKLRIEYDEILYNMAERLNITSSYLSAIENGKRNVPLDWVGKISQMYNLSIIEKKELKETIFRSNRIVNVALDDITDDKKDLAISFARELDTMSKEQIETIREFLKKEE